MRVVVPEQVAELVFDEGGISASQSTDCVIPRAIALGVADSYPLVITPPVRFGAKSRPLSGGARASQARCRWGDAAPVGARGRRRGAGARGIPAHLRA